MGKFYKDRRYGKNMKIIERNLQSIGQSLFVSLPKEWTELLHLQKGSSVKIIISDEGKLLIQPEFVAREVIKESSIPADEHFERRFFREYFAGNTRITIVLAKGVEKRRVYLFLEKFMNVQIIEDKGNKVVVACFKVEDLSIEECLRRMYFLSLGMWDDKTRGKNADVSQARLAMNRFYFMLVLQVRRYIGEGKFVEENKIPLLRAMDMRMIAEKIERIGAILRDVKINLNGQESVRDYYKACFDAFIGSNYNKALGLYQLGEQLLSQFKSKNGDLERLVVYAREISTLTR